MTIELIANKKLKLQIPDFSCDNSPLGEHLNAYPMLSHLNSYSLTSIIGKPGSGKTSLLISMLTGKGKNRVFRQAFEKVIVVMPSSSRASLKKNIFEKHPQERLYEEFNVETVSKIYDQLHI